MRYQLRYIRKALGQCPLRKMTIVHRSEGAQIPARPAGDVRIPAAQAVRDNLRPRKKDCFDQPFLFFRSRGSVGERPLHTRKVAGSIPAGTTSSLPLGV